MTPRDVRGALTEVLPWLRVLGHTPFLWGGTLLGAVRTGRPLSWDGDVDIGLLAEAATDDRLLRPPHGWKVYRNTPVTATMRAVAPLVRGNVGIRRAGIKVGLHLMVDHAGERWFTCHRDLIHVRHITPLVETEFLGMAVAIPADHEAALAWYYGPDWRTPDPAYIGSPREAARRAEYLVRC